MRRGFCKGFTTISHDRFNFKKWWASSFEGGFSLTQFWVKGTKMSRKITFLIFWKVLGLTFAGTLVNYEMILQVKISLSLSNCGRFFLIDDRGYKDLFIFNRLQAFIFEASGENLQRNSSAFRDFRQIWLLILNTFQRINQLLFTLKSSVSNNIRGDRR